VNLLIDAFGLDDPDCWNEKLKGTPLMMKVFEIAAFIGAKMSDEFMDEYDRFEMIYLSNGEDGELSR